MDSHSPPEPLYKHGIRRHMGANLFWRQGTPLMIIAGAVWDSTFYPATLNPVINNWCTVPRINAEVCCMSA